MEATKHHHEGGFLIYNGEIEGCWWEATNYRRKTHKGFTTCERCPQRWECDWTERPAIGTPIALPKWINKGD